jgi:hypothetical protein
LITPWLIRTPFRVAIPSLPPPHGPPPPPPPPTRHDIVEAREDKCGTTTTKPKPFRDDAPWSTTGGQGITAITLWYRRRAVHGIPCPHRRGSKRPLWSSHNNTKQNKFVMMFRGRTLAAKASHTKGRDIRSTHDIQLIIMCQHALATRIIAAPTSVFRDLAFRRHYQQLESVPTALRARATVTSPIPKEEGSRGGPAGKRKDRHVVAREIERIRKGVESIHPETERQARETQVGGGKVRASSRFHLRCEQESPGNEPRWGGREETIPARRHRPRLTKASLKTEEPDQRPSLSRSIQMPRDKP